MTGDTRGPGAPPGHAATVPALARSMLWQYPSLASVHGDAGWLDDWQRLGMQAATAWTESLELAALELDHAGDLDHLLSVPARLIERQWRLACESFGGGLQCLLDAQWQWVNQAQRGWGLTATPWLGGPSPNAAR